MHPQTRALGNILCGANGSPHEAAIKPAVLTEETYDMSLRRPQQDDADLVEIDRSIREQAEALKAMKQHRDERVGELRALVRAVPLFDHLT